MITQRAGNKKHPYMWECTGGSVISGEDSIEGAIREIKEELGINIGRQSAKFIGSTLRYYKGCPDIIDVWVFSSNVLIEDIVIQTEEVNAAMWATPSKIKELYKENKFEANAFFENVLNTENK